jgi:hypothetical protein
LDEFGESTAVETGTCVDERGAGASAEPSIVNSQSRSVEGTFGPVVDSGDARFVGESFYYNAAWDDVFSNKDDHQADDVQDTLASTGYDSDHGLTGTHAPQLNPNKRPLTDPDDDFDWNYWTNLDDPPPPKRPKLIGQTPEKQVLPPLRPALPNEFGQAHGYQVGYVQRPGIGPSTRPVLPVPQLDSPEPEDEEVVQGPATTPDPAADVDHQSSSAESEPVDLLAAIYAAKGKAKESRRVSDTTRDVGNVA